MKDLWNGDDRCEKLSKVKLLALDLDGTVLTDEKKLTDRTKKAICGAIDEGIQTVLVTGRPLAGIPEALFEIPDIRYAITSNGAITTDLRSGKKLRTACLDNDAAKKIARIPMERDFIHSVFVDGIGYCEQPYFQVQWDFYLGTKHEPYIRNSRRGTYDIDKLIDESDTGVENIWFMSHDQKERDWLDEYIRDQWKVKTVLTAATDVEIGSANADKGIALEELSFMLGVHQEEILAIGDNENDLGMFRAAGITVAMGNATENVKKVAQIMTDTNEEDGAGKMIEEITACRRLA